MKMIGMIAAATLAFAGCQKPVSQQPIEPDRPPENATPVVSVTPSPVVASGPVSVTTVAATPAPQFAPPGVFYLLTAARVETGEGVRGLPPGTGVKLVRPGIYLTPAGEAALRDDQVTNNMTLARAARDADRAAQERVARSLAARAAVAEAAQAARDTAPAASPTPANPSSSVAAATPRPPLGSSLGSAPIGQAHNSTKEHTGIDSKGRKYWIDVFGRHHYDF